jgi:NADPH2:quinone reductase
MRAVRVHEVGGPEVLTIEEVPVPEPSATQICIRVLAIGINPVETYIRSGKAGRAPPSLPYTPGQDCAGTIEKIGSEVTSWKVGDRVFSTHCITGSYAQFTLCEQSSLQHLPDPITFDQGYVCYLEIIDHYCSKQLRPNQYWLLRAAIHVPYHTAYHALFHIAKSKDSDVIFIHGCSGATGMACLQLAKSRGHKVIGSAGTLEGLRLVAEQGADFTVNHREEGYMDRVMEYTNLKGVDVIVEMLANVNLGFDLTILAKGGRVAVIGSRGMAQIDARDLMSRRASVHGVFMAHATPEEVIEIDAAIQVGLTEGYLKPIVYLALPFDQIADSHAQVINPSSGAQGKIVVRPWE